MLKTYPTKELKIWYTEAKEKWTKIKKFIEKHKDDEAFVKTLKEITTPEGEKGYSFTIDSFDVILTVYPKIKVIHSCFGWNPNNKLATMALIVPTVISLNDKEYKAGKINILQMFYEQYNKQLTQSLFIHELIHFFQTKRNYDYESIQALNYTPYNIKDNYNTKTDYFNSELEAPVYALQLLWDYTHDKNIKEIIDKYKNKTTLSELESLYREFEIVDHKCLDVLWTQMFYHATPETTIYILDILNRMI